MHMRKPVFTLVFAALFTLGLAACDMMSGREDAGDYVNDAAITTRIKSDLMRTRTMKPLTQVHVTTFKGVVTLAGQVDNRRTADKAISVARAVPSVTGVKDEMEVRGEMRGAPSGNTYTPTAPMPESSPMQAQPSGRRQLSQPPEPGLPPQ